MRSIFSKLCNWKVKELSRVVQTIICMIWVVAMFSMLAVVILDAVGVI